MQASDLGEAVVAPDGRSTLVSFITSPLAVARDNTYVVFVTDPALAASAESYEWSFALDGGAPATETTQHGETTYRPPSTGRLTVGVRILDAVAAEQASLVLTQEVVPVNAELETLIENARNDEGPTVVNPDVARELINDHNAYYQSVALASPEGDDAFQRFVFTMVHDGALAHAPGDRARHLNELSSAINEDHGDFESLLARGVGVCDIRLALLAMTTSKDEGSPDPILGWTEVPETAPARAPAETALRETVAALDSDTRTDLINIARFPKSSITQCGRILERVRDRYFAGVSFNDVLTGMSGTRAHWIVRHFREGPLQHE